MYFRPTPGFAFTKVMSHTGPSWYGRTGAAWASKRLGSNIAANASTAMTRIMFFISWLLIASCWVSEVTSFAAPRQPPLPRPGSSSSSAGRTQLRGMKAVKSYSGARTDLRKHPARSPIGKDADRVLWNGLGYNLGVMQRGLFRDSVHQCAELLQFAYFRYMFGWGPFSSVSRFQMSPSRL